jgi:glyoxylate reductase
MPNSAKKPVVIVTRRLPDTIETRMKELFDTRLNVDDTPMSQAELIEAVKTADVLVPTVTDRIDRAVLSQAGDQLKLIANFGTGVDNIDLDTAPNRSITVTNTPGVLTEDTADMTMALILAVPRRLTEGADRLRENEGGWPAGRQPGCSATASTASASASSAWAGSARPSRAREGLRLQIHYHNRRRCSRRDRAGAGGDLLGQPRPDAGAHGHRLGQLPAHAGDLSPAVGPPPEAAEAGRPIIVNTARGEVIDENELARC